MSSFAYLLAFLPPRFRPVVKACPDFPDYRSMSVAGVRIARFWANRAGFLAIVATQTEGDGA